jgi:hypothetical protein
MLKHVQEQTHLTSCAAHRETPIKKLKFPTMQEQTHLTSCSLELGAHIFVTFSIGVVMLSCHQRVTHPPISVTIWSCYCLSFAPWIP